MGIITNKPKIGNPCTGKAIEERKNNVIALSHAESRQWKIKKRKQVRVWPAENKNIESSQAPWYREKSTKVTPSLGKE